MPKAIWKGGISFGLVYIPVRMYSGSTSHDVDLDMIRRGDKCPIKYVRVCKKDGKEVPWKDIVKGHKVDDDYYITLTDEDFEKASRVKSENIEIISFMKAGEIKSKTYQSQ